MQLIGRRGCRARCDEHDLVAALRFGDGLVDAEVRRLAGLVWIDALPAVCA